MAGKNMVLSSFIYKEITHNRLFCKHLQNKFRNLSSARISETVFIEKVLEEPVIIADENNDVDIIGPPDLISNLRPIIRKCPLSETALQQHLRKMQDATQSWNQDFWTKHNINFIKERKEYVESKQKLGEEEIQLTADEMSEFYKQFLDKNWHLHLEYNAEWYRRNCTLLYLSLRVYLEKMFMKVS